MSSSPQEEIDIIKYNIKLCHRIAISSVIIVSCIAAVPIIISIVKMDSYGGYIMIIASTLYLICLLVVIAKWFVTLSDYKMQIRNKMETIRNPLYRV